MKTTPPHDICPVSQALEQIGERWSILIIRDVFYGIRRFDALRQHLGISKKVLAGRLISLQQAEILHKIPYQQKPQRFEYRLTQKGRDLLPVLLTIMRWENRWLTTESKKKLSLTHLACGEHVEPKVVCSHCDKPLTPAGIRTEITDRADRNNQGNAD